MHIVAVTAYLDPTIDLPVNAKCACSAAGARGHAGAGLGAAVDVKALTEFPVITGAGELKALHVNKISA
jgi:hypothetical protein